MVHHRNTQDLTRPAVRIRVQPLAGRKEGAQGGGVVPGQLCRLGISLADRAQGRGRREQDVDLVVLHHAPECPRIRGPHRLALVEDRGGTGQQRAINNVGMAHHPADVGRRPHHVTRTDVVDVRHGPAERDRMAAVVPHHALGRAGGARGVEDVEGVGCCDVHGCRGGGLIHTPVPVEPARVPGSCLHKAFPVLDNDRRLPCAGEFERFGNRGQILHPARGLNPAGRRDDRGRAGILDAGSKLLGRESAEDHRMHRPEPRRRQHRDGGLGNHGHVDDHPVPFADSLRAQHTREPRHKAGQFGVTVRALNPQHRGVVDECSLVPAAGLNVAVQGVVAGVEHAVRKPAEQRGG